MQQSKIPSHHLVIKCYNYPHYGTSHIIKILKTDIKNGFVTESYNPEDLLIYFNDISEKLGNLKREIITQMIKNQNPIVEYEPFFIRGINNLLCPYVSKETFLNLVDDYKDIWNSFNGFYRDINASDQFYTNIRRTYDEQDKARVEKEKYESKIKDYIMAKIDKKIFADLEDRYDQAKKIFLNYVNKPPSVEIPTEIEEMVSNYHKFNERFDVFTKESEDILYGEQPKDEFDTTYENEEERNRLFNLKILEFMGKSIDNGDDYLINNMFIDTVMKTFMDSSQQANLTQLTNKLQEKICSVINLILSFYDSSISADSMSWGCLDCDSMNMASMNTCECGNPRPRDSITIFLPKSFKLLRGSTWKYNALYPFDPKRDHKFFSVSMKTAIIYMSGNTQIGDVNIQTSSYLYCQFLGEISVYETKNHLKLFNLSHANTVRHILKKLQELNAPSEVVEAFEYGWSLQNDEFVRQTTLEFDFIFINWLCEKGFNGYLATNVKELHDEIFICNTSKNLRLTEINGVDEFNVPICKYPYTLQSTQILSISE